MLAGIQMLQRGKTVAKMMRMRPNQRKGMTVARIPVARPLPKKMPPPRTQKVKPRRRVAGPEERMLATKWAMTKLLRHRRTSIPLPAMRVAKRAVVTTRLLCLLLVLLPPSKRAMLRLQATRKSSPSTDGGFSALCWETFSPVPGTFKAKPFLWFVAVLKNCLYLGSYYTLRPL